MERGFGSATRNGDGLQRREEASVWKTQGDRKYSDSSNSAPMVSHTPGEEI